MLHDPKRRIALIEVIVASGLVAIGFATGQEPMQTLATATATTVAAKRLVDAAANVGIDWVASLSERGFQYWRKHWLSDSGVLNKHIARALNSAFSQVVETLEVEWRQHPHYHHLQRTDPDIAQQTLEALRWLRQDSSQLFQQPDLTLSVELKRQQGATLLDQDEKTARVLLTDALNNYLYGYDEQFFRFIQSRSERLVDMWLLHFVEILRDPEKGTEAWRAYQHLQLTTLTVAVQDVQQQINTTRAAVGQVQQTIDEALGIINWLKQRAQESEDLPPAQRDPIGAEALLRLKQIRSSVVRIEDSQKRVEDGIAKLLEQGALLSSADDLLDPVAVRRLFGPSVRLVDIAGISPASEDEVQRYYKGAPLTWNIIVAKGDVERDQQNALWEFLKSEAYRTRMLCLSGEPGAGKSTLAWRLAAEFTQRTGQPLLHMLDNQAREAWYYLEIVVQQYDTPLVLLVDDVFRSEDARRALESLFPDLRVTIISTSRSNEIPRDLRLPFLLKTEYVSAPTESEKTRLLQKMGHNYHQLSRAQRIRLQRANSWLVMMLESTAGHDLTKIVYNSVKRLKQRDEIVYRAYEYLCYAGQYDLVVPEALMVGLDDRGMFYNLPERPASEGFIFRESRWEGSLRTLHAVIARESLRVYNRDPTVLMQEFVGSVQPSRPEQRLFLINLLYRVLSDQQGLPLRALLAKMAREIDAVLAASSISELVDLWARFYRLVGDQKKAFELEEISLGIRPETHNDWHSYTKLLKRRGTTEQLVAAIDAAAEWLAVRPGEGQALSPFFALLKSMGSAQQVAEVIDATTVWLAEHRKRANPPPVFLRLVESMGSAQQVAEVIDATTVWLAEHPRDIYVRQNYLRLLTSMGTAEQASSAIDATGKWLAENPQDVHVRIAYLGLVGRIGTTEQVSSAIDAIGKWLAENPADYEVRRNYLGLVRKHGSAEQLVRAGDLASDWLKRNPSTRDSVIRYFYGRILLRLEHYQEAESQFRHVLEHEKGNASARIGLGWSLYYQDRQQEALKELESAKLWAERTGRYPVGAALHHLGRYHMLEGTPDQGILFFQQATTVSPEHYGNQWELGRALLAQARYAEALTALKSAEELVPNSISEEDRKDLEGLIALARSHCDDR